MIVNSWRGMIERCTNQRHVMWRYYGGAGVTVCERWRGFNNFLCDMGLPPHDDMQIDRVDPKRGYEPGNCRWVTASQNGANRRSWGKSGMRGVYQRPSGRFAAVINAGRTVTIGTFDTKEEAAAAVDAALAQRFGEFAMTNLREGRL